MLTQIGRAAFSTNSQTFKFLFGKNGLIRNSVWKESQMRGMVKGIKLVHTEGLAVNRFRVLGDRQELIVKWPA